jgi:hypothetical protein
MKLFISLKVLAYIALIAGLFGLSHNAAEAKELPKTVSSGKLISVEAFESKFVPARNVHIWLPETYDNKTKYPVLYMHDGHMLFDGATTWNKQEWGVDEVASSLIEQNKVRPFIVVGIDSIDETRYIEYFPQKAQSYAEKTKLEVPEAFSSLTFSADNYLKFLVTELKPYVEKNYSVSTKLGDTGIMGSSMGGLISMYAISEYPEVFGMAACVSTHFPGWIPTEPSKVGDAILGYMNESLPTAGKHKIYFDYGTEGIDAYYEPYQVQADGIMIARGYDKASWITFRDEGAGHNEESWNSRLHRPLTFLFGVKPKENR